MNDRKQLLILAALGISLLVAGPAQAGELVFNLDPQASSLSLSGVFGAFPILSQDAPSDTSLTTTYSGTVTVDVDDLLSPSTIAFIGANAIAANSGDWVPEVGGGTEGVPPTTAAPANYGAYVDAGNLAQAWAAFRDVEFTITGGAEALAGGSFASSQSYALTSGSFDFNVISPVLGNDADNDSVIGDSAANSAANGSLLIEGDLATLTLPVMLEFPGDLTIQFAGTLVGTAVVPEPHSALLTVCGLLAVVARTRRYARHRI